jgi:hypothetical protein
MLAGDPALSQAVVILRDMNVDPSGALPPLAAPLRARVLDVRRWALAAGRRVDAGVLGLILAAKTWHTDEPLDRWSRIGVYQSLYSGVWNWCTVHGARFPDDLPEVLWRYLSYLEETRQFEKGSDPVRELRRPLRCYGGLGPDGLPAPADAPRVKCVCKVPYRRRPVRRGSQAG